jgi:NAD(P)H dehydrogenase (quinone)
MPADPSTRTPAEAVRLQYLASATDDMVSAAARADYAAAAPAVLPSEGHENRAYEPGGDTAFTLEDLAAEIAAQTGTPVRYQHLPERDFAQILAANRLRQEFAAIIADAGRGLARGQWFTDNGDPQCLIGRPATALADVIADAVRANAA